MQVRPVFLSVLVAEGTRRSGNAGARAPSSGVLVVSTTSSSTIDVDRAREPPAAVEESVLASNP
jgi:hypothetical protein